MSDESVAPDESVADDSPGWGTGTIVAYLASAAAWVLISRLDYAPLIAGLIWALILRGIYIAIRRRRGDPSFPFWSPWVFVLAAACTFFSVVGANT